MSKTCSNCGANLPDDAKVCSQCGASVPENNNSAGQTTQQTYSQPMYYQVPEDTSPMTLGNYMITMLISFIPVVGLVMLLIWAFSKETNVNKKNYARATLIYMVIGFVLSIILWSAIIAIFATAFNGSYTY